MIKKTHRSCLGLFLSLAIPCICSPGMGKEASFKVVSLIVHLENRAPTVIEWPVKVQIIDSYLIASAEGSCNIPKGEKWIIGYLQVITGKECKQIYSKIWTEFKFPKYPFTDCTASTAPFYAYSEIEGTGSDQKFEVSMNDNTGLNVSWKQPAPPKGDEVGDPDLRKIDREQEFTTWLLCKKIGTNKVILLRRFSWKTSYHAVVDPAAPLGNRVRLAPRTLNEPKVEDPHADDLQYLERNQILLAKKCSNDCEMLYWFSKTDPSRGIPLLVNTNPYK